MMLGGIPKGSLTLLLGPPGAGKSILSKLFIHSGISQGSTAFLVSTSESDQTIAETMELFKWGAGTNEKLHILDCYSWRLGGSGAKYAAALTLLTDVSVMLTKIMEDFKASKEGESRLVIDSFSDFIKYAGVDKALKFLDSTRLKLRERGTTGLVLLEDGVHDERTVAAVEYSTDGTIRMRVSEQGRYMMLSRLLATPISPHWIPFTIGG